MAIAAYLRVAAVICAAAGIAGCGTSPETIVGDDAALCRYAAEAGSAESLAVCRGRLDSRHRSRTAAAASRIDGYALLNAPAEPAALASPCRPASPPQACEAGDVTGAIGREPAR